MPEESLTEFLKKIKKVSAPRKHKITNSYGVYDAFKYYRKNKPADKKYILTESQFFALIRSIHNNMLEDLVNGKELIFPMQMGGLELRKYHIEPKLDENGKLIYKAPINWAVTLQCWYEHEEAYKNKLLIKSETRDYYKLCYLRYRAKYKNKSYFNLRGNRALKLKISQAAKKGTLEAFAFKTK